MVAWVRSIAIKGIPVQSTAKIINSLFMYLCQLVENVRYAPAKIQINEHNAKKNGLFLCHRLEVRLPDLTMTWLLNSKKGNMR